MLRHIHLLFAMLVLPVVATAQYENLLHKPYAEKAGELHVLYQGIAALQDSIQVAKKTEEVKQFARKHNDRELELEMDLFLAHNNAFRRNQSPSESIKTLKNLIVLADKENIWQVKIGSTRVLAECYWHLVKNYELAFEQYFLLDKLLGTINEKDYPEMARDFMQIGESYYFFHDYTQAKRYLKKVLALPETDFNSILLNTSRNTLGLCYQEEKQYDSSDYYFNQVLQTKFPKPKAAWERIVTGNIGANHYYRKDYDKAIPLLEYDYYGAVKANDFGPAAGAAILLADIFLSRSDFKKSWTYVENATENIKKVGQKERLRLLYPVISKWYSATGQGKLSQLYQDSTVAAINEYHAKYDAMKVLRAQQKISMQEEELRRAELTLEKQKKANERNVLISVIVGLIVIVALGYYIHKKRQLAKDMAIMAVNQELRIATINLNQFTESISEKNKLIEQLKSHYSDGERSELVQELQQSTILTEEDWQAFQRMFNSVYPGFMTRVKHTYPELSVGEIRYFLLVKLNLSHKEMSAMLGVSPNSVHVMRHRMRKKLNLSEKAVIEDMIGKI